MSKHNDVSVFGSIANVIKTSAITVERSVELVSRTVDLAHKELDIIEQRQALRIEDATYALAEAKAVSATKRKKLA